MVYYLGMGIFNFFFGEEQFIKDTIVIGGENVFIYVDRKGAVSLKHVHVSLDDDDRFHGTDMYQEETRTYLKDNVLKIFGEKEFKKYSEKQMLKLVEEYQKDFEIKNDKPNRKYQINSGNAFEVCFTGFKAIEKAVLINLAKDSQMIVRSKVTPNIDMLVCGPSSGPSKLESAKNIGIVITDADGFKKLIETGEM